MTTEFNIDEALEFSIQQIFAESYWEKYWEKKSFYLSHAPTTSQGVTAMNNTLRDAYLYALTHGNSTKPDIPDGGYTKLTDTLAADAYETYEVVDYIGNQNAGFSAILLRNKFTTEYTLTFRSTEYKEDFARDAVGADTEITNNGFAYGQISEMEKYYQYLISNNIIPLDSSSPTGHETINVSGYSLGGHLAYAFYVMHPDAVAHVYAENGAGIGTIGFAGSNAKTLSNYNSLLTSANIRFTSIKDNFITALFGATVAGALNSSNVTQVLNSLSYGFNSSMTIVSSGLTGTLQTLANTIASGLTDLLTNTDPNYHPLSGSLLLFKSAIQKSIANTPYSESSTYGYTIYEDVRYQLAIKITQQEYNSKANPAFDKFFAKFTGADGGSVENAIFNTEMFTVISGKGDTSIFGAGDQNLVSKSNLHAVVNDIFVEDQNEMVQWMGRLPVLPRLTEYVKGDFGNTHSLTLLVDSLRAARTLQLMSNNLTLDIKKTNDIFSSASNQHASFHSGFFFQDNAVESNSISNVINYLYKLLIVPVIGQPVVADVNFDRTPTYLGDVNKRNTLHQKENILMDYSKTHTLQIKSLYDSSNTTNTIETVTSIINKAKQNDAEGLAYRYALHEMSNIVVIGADYSAININGALDKEYHSELWYKARAEILVSNISNNISNSEVYGLNLAYTNPQQFADLLPNIQKGALNLLNSPLSDYGVIKDEISSKQLKYFGQSINNIFNNNVIKKTIFGSDAYKAVNILNSSIYTDSIYDDKIFTGNGYNTINLSGGHDIVETGKGTNIINMLYSDKKEVLEAYLFGNNVINLNDKFGLNVIRDTTGQIIDGGTLYYKNKKLTGGYYQTSGTFSGQFIDKNYSNIVYEYVFEYGKNVLNIKYYNDDNTYDTTKITNINQNTTIFNLEFNIAPEGYTNTTTVDMSQHVTNPYLNTKAIVTRIYDNPNDPNAWRIEIPSGYTDTTVSSGGYYYLYGQAKGGSARVSTNDMPGPVNLAPVTWALGSGNMYYRPGDGLVIPKNMDFLNYVIERSGDDLLFKHKVEIGNTSEYTLSTLKNYFNFINTSHTGIFFYNSSGTAAGAELTFEELSRYNTLISPDGNLDITSSVSYSTIFSGISGNKKITSAASTDTTFVNQSINLGFSNSPTISTGNDIMISGSGNNRFVFIGNHGSDIIENIKTTDKIIFGYAAQFSTVVTTAEQAKIYAFYNKELVKDANDLVIKDTTTSTAINNNSVRIKNYYTVFGDSPVHSGIYVEDAYGVSYELDISDFETARQNTLILDDSATGIKTIGAGSPITSLNLGACSAEITLEKNGMTIFSDGGLGDQKITCLEAGLTPSTEPKNIIKIKPVPDSSTSIEVINFTDTRDTLSIANADSTDVITTKDDNDLVIRQLSDGEVIGTYTLKNYFVNNYNVSNPTGSSGLAIYNGTATSPLTISALGTLLADFVITRTANNTTVDVGDLNRNTKITSTGLNAHITGGKFNDDITAGSGYDKFYMSEGKDTYHLNSSSGIDELVFDKAHLNNAPKVIIQFDSSIDEEDVSFYYDPYQEYFTIKTGTDSGLVISNVDRNTSYYLENFIQVKLSNGDNLFDNTFVINNGSPLAEPDEPENIIIGTTANNTLQAASGKSSLVFGGDGNDSITGNQNIITTGNTEYKSNLLVGGKGNDNIYVGSYDLITASEGDGADTVNYSNNHDDFVLNLLKNNTTNQAFGVKTVSNDLELYYSNNTTDKMIIKDYWIKSRADMALALTDKEGQDTYMRAYSINDIMTDMGYNKTNMGTTIHYVDYDEIESLMILDNDAKLIGGELTSYYSEVGNFTGFAQGGALDILNQLNNESIMSKTGFNDPADYRKLA